MGPGSATHRCALHRARDTRYRLKLAPHASRCNNDNDREITMLMFNNLIDGEWMSDGARSPNVNPSDTNDIVGEAVRGTRAQAGAAVAAAKAAFPAWSRSTPQVRYDILKKASDEILARKDELGRLLSREEGKTLPEGVGEAARAGQIFAFFAGEWLARSWPRCAPASTSRSPAKDLGLSA